MHHRALGPHQPRPRRHPCDGRDERLRHFLSHGIALARRARRRRHRRPARRAPRRNLLAATGERHRRRHRADAVRDRPCILSRKAADRADGAAAPRDRFRMVERRRAGSRRAADQRAVSDRRRAGADPVLGLSDDAMGFADPHRRREFRRGARHGIFRSCDPLARNHGRRLSRRESAARSCRCSTPAAGTKVSRADRALPRSRW